MQKNDDLLEKVFAMAKRRGFIYPSSEIYGGLANTYDFGPYGTELKENVRKLWWDKFIRRGDILGIDSSIILNPEIWEASGHVANFGDIMVEDKVNHKRYRADHIIEEFAENNKDLSEQEQKELRKVDGLPALKLQEIIEKYRLKSPDGNEFLPARKFNQLFETSVGIIEGEKNKVYLRGEIAQGLFTNFKNIIDTIHPKLPFGIGQAGKAFRNEITKGKLTFRTLEFDLMEFEYFFDSEKQDWNELFDYWKEEMYDFALQIGLNKAKLRWRKHEEFELSHYSKRTEDLEYEFPWGHKEMWGCAYRTDFDLKNHSKHSGVDMQYVYPDGKKVTPHVIEPTFGLSRLITILLMDAYSEEEVNGKLRVVCKLHPRIAPVKAAVIVLQKDEKLEKLARSIYADLSKEFNVEFENKGNIGKMYRRHDEIGTPFCITVDYTSLEDNSVTIRDRDTMEQSRVKISDLQDRIKKLVA